MNRSLDIDFFLQFGDQRHAVMRNNSGLWNPCFMKITMHNYIFVTEEYEESNERDINLSVQWRVCYSPVCPKGVSLSLYLFSLLNSQNPQAYNVENMWKTKSPNPLFSKTAFYFDLIILKRCFWWHRASESAPLHLQTTENPWQFVSLFPASKSCRKSYSLILFPMKGLTAHCCNKTACYEDSIHKIDLQHIKYRFSNFHKWKLQWKCLYKYTVQLLWCATLSSVLFVYTPVHKSIISAN